MATTTKAQQKPNNIPDLFKSLSPKEIDGEEKIYIQALTNWFNTEVKDIKDDSKADISYDNSLISLLVNKTDLDAMHTEEDAKKLGEKFLEIIKQSSGDKDYKDAPLTLQQLNDSFTCGESNLNVTTPENVQCGNQGGLVIKPGYDTYEKCSNYLAELFKTNTTQIDSDVVQRIMSEMTIKKPDGVDNGKVEAALSMLLEVSNLDKSLQTIAISQLQEYMLLMRFKDTFCNFETTNPVLQQTINTVNAVMNSKLNELDKALTSFSYPNSISAGTPKTESAARFDEILKEKMVMLSGNQQFITRIDLNTYLTFRINIEIPQLLEKGKITSEQANESITEYSSILDECKLLELQNLFKGIVYYVQNLLESNPGAEKAIKDQLKNLLQIELKLPTPLLKGGASSNGQGGGQGSQIQLVMFLALIIFLSLQMYTVEGSGSGAPLLRLPGPSTHVVEDSKDMTLSINGLDQYAKDLGLTDGTQGREALNNAIGLLNPDGDLSTSKQLAQVVVGMNRQKDAAVAYIARITTDYALNAKTNWRTNAACKISYAGCYPNIALVQENKKVYGVYVPSTEQAKGTGDESVPKVLFQLDANGDFVTTDVVKLKDYLTIASTHTGFTGSTFNVEALQTYNYQVEPYYLDTTLFTKFENFVQTEFNKLIDNADFDKPVSNSFYLFSQTNRMQILSVEMRSYNVNPDNKTPLTQEEIENRAAEYGINTHSFHELLQGIDYTLANGAVPAGMLNRVANANKKLRGGDGNDISVHVVKPPSGDSKIAATYKRALTNAVYDQSHSLVTKFSIDVRGLKQDFYRQTIATMMAKIDNDGADGNDDGAAGTVPTDDGEFQEGVASGTKERTLTINEVKSLERWLFRSHEDPEVGVDPLLVAAQDEIDREFKTLLAEKVKKLGEDSVGIKETLTGVVHGVLANAEGVSSRAKESWFRRTFSESKANTRESLRSGKQRVNNPELARAAQASQNLKDNYFRSTLGIEKLPSFTSITTSEDDDTDKQVHLVTYNGKKVYSDEGEEELIRNLVGDVNESVPKSAINPTRRKRLSCALSGCLWRAAMGA